MKDISWAACLRLGVTAAAVYMVCAGGGIPAALVNALSPLLLGGGLAFVMNIPMQALERRFFPQGGRIGRMVGLTASLAGVLVLAACFAGVILPEALQCATLLMNGLPGLLGSLAGALRESGAARWLEAAGLADWQTLAEHSLRLALEGAGGWLGTAADMLTTLMAGAANAALGLIFALYLLAGKERIAAQLMLLTRRMLGEVALQRITRVMAALSSAFRSYTAGQCLEALILGCLCLIGMTVLRLPGAVTISVMAGITSLIPLAGPPLAACVGAMLLLPQGASAAITFAVFFLVLQQVENSLIGPRVTGASLGLPPVWTLAAMVAGGGLFGVIGAVVAVPVAAAARTLLLKENVP